VRIALVAAVKRHAAQPAVPRMLVSWLAAGFFAVYLYCRKTGFRLDVLAGVKIGWITGLIALRVFAVVFTAQQLPDALAGHLGKSILEQMKNSTFQDPAMMQEMTKMVADNPGW
jgi:nitric oxide reductase large subunit